MEQILKKVHNVDPNNSEDVKETLSSFFQCISKYKELHSHRLLRELNIIINRFPKFCLSQRNNIETFLISFLSSNNYFNVIEAAKCAHALQQVRPSQEKSATPKSSWRDQMNDLCNAAHSLIESVYTNAVEVYKNSPTPSKSASTPMSTALIDIAKVQQVKHKQSFLLMRLKNVLVFIQAMLVEIYPVAKPVQPQTILDVIVRLLSVSSGTKQYDMDTCTVKIQTLRTLDALIVCLGPNLIPYSPLVFRLVLQTLKWSSDHVSEHTSKVRCSAYSSLSTWLTTLRTHKISDTSSVWEDSLSHDIISDITPAKKVVKLTMGLQPTRHLSKKAKRKLATTQLQESNLAAYAPGENNKISVSDEVNNGIAKAALDCAEIFLTVCGRFLKPATHKLFQELLIRECYNYPSYADEQLLGLLRVLESTRKTAPANVPPTTQYCLHLYSLLINSRSTEISIFCSQALLDIRLHLHCSPPSLNFALDEPHENGKNANKRKKVSGRNRAMLESLLGADKIPSEEIDDDVISIPDEPSSKKLRLGSNETDQISIHSSNTEGSVEEVCDDSDNDNVQHVVNIEMNDIQKCNDDELIIVEQDTDPIQDSGQNTSTNLIYPEIEQQETNGECMDNQIAKLNGTLEVQRDVACANVKDESEISKAQEDISIYEAETQVPINVSIDAIEEDRPSSLEVGYDYPNTGKEKVTVLEKLDDENLPSTNDSDDIQITCGQVIKNSQELDAQKRSCETEQKTDDIKVNGLGENIVANGVTENTTEPETNKNAEVLSKNDGVSVEEMLADFVDEVGGNEVEDGNNMIAADDKVIVAENNAVVADNNIEVLA